MQTRTKRHLPVSDQGQERFVLPLPDGTAHVFGAGRVELTPVGPTGGTVWRFGCMSGKGKER